MATTGYQVRQAVARLGEEIQELAWTVGRDPKEEARLRRRWSMLEGALGAVATIAARQLAARAWGVLTGEVPPNRRAAPRSAPSRHEHEQG